MTRAVIDRYLSRAEEKQLLGHIDKFKDELARRDHAWMVLARYTGVRVGVLNGLNVADARRALATGYLHVRGEINKKVVKGTTGKRRTVTKSYTVRLHKKATLSLKRLLKIRKAMGGIDDPDHPLILGRRGERMSIRSFEARMTGWVEAAGLSIKATPHWWRHTLAMRIMEESEAKDPLAHIQRVLGHDSIVSTSIYTLPKREETDEIMERLA